MIPDRVRAHEEAFKPAFRSGDRGPFLATFADDAVMRFEGVPVGPCVGRPAIAAAYVTRPPTDTMAVRHAESVGDTDGVRFSWDAGGAGVLTVRWRDDRVAELMIPFD
ncbi:MAG TPA: nuclear transport factor 2 family protein [Asanoa sp.]